MKIKLLKKIRQEYHIEHSYFYTWIKHKRDCNDWFRIMTKKRLTEILKTFG